MLRKLMELLKKYRELLLYGIFGVVTTVVNVVVYWLCYERCGVGSDSSVVIAWIVAVLVAFVTNKLWVFDSKSWAPRVALPEALNFFGFRLGTGVLELVLMHVLVTMLGLPGTLMKLSVNVIVIILNYIASKLVIFRRH